MQKLTAIWLLVFLSLVPFSSKSSLVETEKNGNTYLVVPVEVLESKTSWSFLTSFIKSEPPTQWLNKRVATLGYFWDSYDNTANISAINTYAVNVPLYVDDVMTRDQKAALLNHCGYENCVMEVYGYMRRITAIDDEGDRWKSEAPRIELILHVEYIAFHPDIDKALLTKDSSPESYIGTALSIVDFLSGLK